MPFPSNSLYPSNLLFPSDGDQPIPDRIRWSQVGERRVEAGLDRGVLYLNDRYGVPWNGLVSVAEDGGENVSEFNMDGRPFLHLPSPKEYSATLNAHTYPDEFEEVMGIVEIASGLSIDSQQSDSFGLSYRTLMGNDLVGFDAGYKIHLIYNATVAAQGVTYSTLGDSISPVDFSWGIRAVPVNILGHRATAHITINSARVSPEDLLVLETILYGNGVDIGPSLPNPDYLVDLLSFGDAIVIEDNGDGTWSASGSSANIYMTGQDTFKIDNVNSIDHGDGTYTVSSTG